MSKYNMIGCKHSSDQKTCRMTELAYKYFFKTLNAQAERLMQSTEVQI